MGNNFGRTQSNSNYTKLYDSSDYSAILYNSSDYSAILYNSSDYSAILYNSSDYSAILYNSSEISAILNNSSDYSAVSIEMRMASPPSSILPWIAPLDPRILNFSCWPDDMMVTIITL